MPVETGEAQKAQNQMVFLMNFADEFSAKYQRANNVTR